MRETVDRAGVTLSDRSHLDDLALEQLDPIVLREDAHLDQPVVLLHGEPSPLELDRRVHRDPYLILASPDVKSTPNFEYTARPAATRSPPPAAAPRPSSARSPSFAPLPRP